MALTPVQRRVLVVAGATALGLPILKRMLKTEFFDASRYYVYYGTTGPYGVTQPPGEGQEGTLGEIKTLFHAGEWIGFVSDLNVEAGVGLLGERMLVRASDQRVVYREERRLPPGVIRSGKRNYFVLLPADIKPGGYELRVKATFFPPDQPAVSTSEFPSLPFEVV